jgi:hypothetical protein
MANFKIKVRTSDLKVDEVANDDNDQVLRDEAPNSNAVQVAIIEIVLDTDFGGCWWVHQATVDQWWEWPHVCPHLPKIMIKVNDRGKIKQAAFKFTGSNGWEDLVVSNNRPSKPSVRLSIIIQSEVALGPCRYVVIGGRAYKIC